MMAVEIKRKMAGEGAFFIGYHGQKKRKYSYNDHRVTYVVLGALSTGY
jgi:hypothetical protein